MKVQNFSVKSLIYKTCACMKHDDEFQPMQHKSAQNVLLLQDMQQNLFYFLLFSGYNLNVKNKSQQNTLQQLFCSFILNTLKKIDN